MRGDRRAARRVAMAALLALAAASPSVAVEGPAGLAMHDSPRPLPEVTFEDATGRPLSLRDFRGRVVLLNLWATWCAPCRKEMPTLDRLQGELGGPGFEVVALSIDRKGLPVVESFYKEIGLRRLAIYVDASSRAARSLKALGIPTTLLIDREGGEIGRLAGPAEWDSPEMVAFLRHVVEQGGGQDGTANEARR